MTFRLPLPMTVVGGYLGTGKTTLINQLLSAPQGQRLMVMVNDFGAINIDAALLHSASEDTLTLTNGCVCCTMGADLFMAIGDVLDRNPRPDHLIVEASGVADPQKIANAALTEPELSYGGILSLVDAENFAALQADPLIKDQIESQVSCADLLVVSKADHLSQDLANRLGKLSGVAPLLAQEIEDLSALLLEPRAPFAKGRSAPAAHPAYRHWSHNGKVEISAEALHDILKARPKGLYRLKGFVRGQKETGWQVHCVGRQITVTPHPKPEETSLVGIGLASQVAEADCQNWWQDCMALSA